MSATNIIRAILREYPAARQDETCAYFIHLAQFNGGMLGINKPIKINTFLKLWQKHRQMYI